MTIFTSRQFATALTGMLLLCIIGLPQAWASHIAGGSISYQYSHYNAPTDEYVYTVRIDVFRDRSGINLSSQIDINVWEIDTNIILGTYQLDTIHKEILSPYAFVCVFDSIAPQDPSYDWFIFEGDIALPNSLKTHILTYNLCCRNFGIVNLDNSSGQGFTLSATIPPHVYQNSSPVFSDPLPPFVCNNYTVNINQAITEVDGDQLVYSFVAPYGDISFTNGPLTDTVVYTPGYNAQDPLGTGTLATINPGTGVITIHPDSTGVYLFGIGVKEFRNGTLLSETRFEFPIQVIDCQTIVNGCVWPGDANNDMICNIYDILPVGVGYGTSHFGRPGASNSWYAQNASDWPQNFAPGVNYKHADCNGDGTIDANDLGVIGLNYGLVHSKGSTWRGGPDDPPLILKIESDSLRVGEHVEVAVYYGSDSIPASNLYGLAISIEYNNTLIDSGFSTFNMNDAWLGTHNVDYIAMGFDLYEEGHVGFGLVRTDHQNISGHGKLGSFSLKLADDIDGTGFNAENLVFDIKGVQIIDKDENQLEAAPANPAEVTVYEGDPPSQSNGIARYSKDQVKIYPNPAQQAFFVKANGMEAVKVMNILGEVVHLQGSITANQFQVDASGLQSGIYMIQVATSYGTFIQKVSVQH